MFFQQSHTARNAMDEAEEGEMAGYYLDPPPWMISNKKRLSTASALSSRSRRSVFGGDLVVPSRSASMESAQLPSRRTSAASRDQRIYSRQSSSGRSLPVQPSCPGESPHKSRGHPITRRLRMLMSSSFGLFLIIQTYLCLGAFCFMWLEAAKEEEQMNRLNTLRTALARGLVSCSGNVTCHEEALIRWEHKLLMFPQIYLEIHEDKVWSWIYSYYCSFTIISTIGYGNVTPLSVAGRLFAVVYAVVGIPLMLLFITDIGNKFARAVKIAIIKFRKWKYQIRKHFRRRKGQNGDAESKDEGVETGETEGDARSDVGVDQDSPEAGGVAPRRDTGYGMWDIPEVHINIAMSTMDEEACEVENKPIAGVGGTAKGLLPGIREGQTTDKGGHLDIDVDNSDYGGSSTGVEGCIADTTDVVSLAHAAGVAGEDARNPVPQEPAGNCQRPAEDTGEDNGEKGDPVSYPTLDTSDPSEVMNADDVFVDIETGDADSPRPSRNDDTWACEPIDSNGGKDRTDTGCSSVVEAEICKYDPSDVLHTSSVGQRHTLVPERICDKCGQTVKSSTNGQDEFERPHSDNQTDRYTAEMFSQTAKNVSSTSSPDDQSMHTDVIIQVDNKTIGHKYSTSSLPSYYTSIADHERLSRKRSRSLEGVSEQVQVGQVSESNHQRPALKGTQPRRTSIPGGVSFQTKPAKPNGRLPHASDPHHYQDHADGSEGEGNFRDRTAGTDSGVASSSSNSTECSPKRRLNPNYPSALDSSGDDDVLHGDGSDGALSEDDVMDPEEEQRVEKLRQLRFGAARPSLAGGRDFMRVSEADIAMLSIPIWLALLLLLIYLLMGAGCFATMQDWTFLDGFYYSFISLSTIGFGDLVFLPQNIHIGLVFSFVYSFIGLCFTSMCMSLSSMELTLLSRKISAKFGVYRGRIRSIREKRWTSRRRKTIRVRSTSDN